MTIRKLFQTKEERAVSPVIGVILMVAITVVLAAVIGMFVMGLGDDLGGNAPSAQVSAEWDSDNSDVVFTHNSGDSIETSNLKVVYEGTQHEVNASVETFSSGVQLSANTDTDSDLGTDGTLTQDDTISLVYDDGSSSVTLQTYGN